MAIKVSIIVLIEKFDKDLFDKCIKSIINQSLKDIEIICVYNNKQLDFKNLKETDSRINIIYTKDNLKKESLKYAKGEYVCFVDSNDWIDFQYCEYLYEKSKKENLDLILFKILIYDNNQFYNNYYYNFSNFEEEFLENVFSYEDISEIMFDIPKGTLNKFFNTRFLKEINPFCSEKILFNELYSFFNIILKAKNIALFDKYLYFKQNINSSNLIDENILRDVLNITNEICSIFKRNNLYEQYFIKVLNYKIEMIRYWYSLMSDSVKIKNFKYIKNDFLNMSDGLLLDNPKRILTERNHFFYMSIINSSDFYKLKEFYKIFNLKKLNNLLKMENKQFSDDIIELNQSINILKNENGLKFLTQSLPNDVELLKSVINKQENNLEKLINAKFTLENEIKLKNNIINDYENKITNYKNEIKNLNQINENNKYELDSKNNEILNLTNNLRESNLETNNINGINELLKKDNKKLTIIITEKNTKIKLLKEELADKDVEIEYYKNNAIMKIIGKTNKIFE